jgi:ribosomal-protein-alanine N-acetyltransferase
MEWEKAIIQQMEIKDLDEVLAIETPESLTPWSRNMFIEEMRNPSASCFVMKREGESSEGVIGFICFRNMSVESELLNIGVHPHWRRLGIGRKMMQFYIDFCGRARIKTFYLEVNSSNQSAIDLYHLFSYQSFGRRKNFYQGKFDALLMMKKA